MSEPILDSGRSHAMDPNERRWLERKAIELARELKCPLPEALVAARWEFESLRTRPKAVVIPLVGRVPRTVRGPQEASS
jgi:hypothetical protein